MIVAVKPDAEALQSPLSFPSDAAPANFSTRVERRRARPLAPNSLIITGRRASLASIALGSICAYAIAPTARDASSTALYFLFVLAIILPFQLGLVPTYAVMRDFGLVGSYLGIILLYTGHLDAVLGLPLYGLRHGPAEGLRGGVAGRRRDLAADVPAGSSSRCCGR